MRPTCASQYARVMRRKLVLVMISSLLLSSGVAFAGRGHRGKHKGHKHDRVVVRDHRGGGGARVRHVRVNNGRYMFPGGVVRVYKRPKVRRYYNVRVRPPIVVEHYDPVPGYVWVAGSWSWGGSEWVWTPGYWAADVAVVAPPPPPPPTVRASGGISVSGGITIR